MAKRNGSKIKILLDGATISNLTTVSMSINGAMIDVTTKDSNSWKEVLPGLKDVTMTADGIVDDSSTVSPATSFTKITNGTSCAVIFYSTVTGDKAYSATGYINKIDFKAGTEDNYTFSLSITISGQLTSLATT